MGKSAGADAPNRAAAIIPPDLHNASPTAVNPDSDYALCFPHVNLTPSEPSSATVIPWHSSRDDEIVDVWRDQNVWRDRDAHAVSVVVIDGPLEGSILTPISASC
jgi:hypothetical protein